VFVLGPIIFGDLPVATLPDLEALAWDRYLTGLHAAGWRGDPRLVRLGYTATVAMRRLMMAARCAAFLSDERNVVHTQDVMGEPIDVITDRNRHLFSFCAARSDEARDLMRALEGVLESSSPH
jgi:hypothetical protein